MNKNSNVFARQCLYPWWTEEPAISLSRPTVSEGGPNLRGPLSALVRKNKSISCQASCPTTPHTSLFSQDLIVICSAGCRKTRPSTYNQNKNEFHSTANKSTSGKGWMLCIWFHLYNLFLWLAYENSSIPRVGTGPKPIWHKVWGRAKSRQGVRKRVEGCRPPPPPSSSLEEEKKRTEKKNWPF